jgi:hypothetical protein
MNGRDYLAPPVMDRIQQRSLVIGGLAAVALIVGAFLDKPQFFRSFLLGYIFWLGVTLGSLAILMVHHLSGGLWGFVVRRLLEAATRLLPGLAALFVVFAFGMKELFPWARPEVVAADALLQHKALYLNVTGFWMRAAVYFFVWMALAFFLNKHSATQDREDDPVAAKWLEGMSGPGLVLFGLTATFASFDWMMSLDPHWFSTIFGVLVMGGMALSAMAFVIAMAALLARHEPMNAVLQPGHFHDLGKLMLAFVMLWAYFAFSQFLIIWSANLPEEIPWYLHRLHGGWQAVALGLVVFHFALPFLLLLSRDLKTNARRVARVAALVLAARFLDLLWLIAPNFPEGQHGVHVSWMDVAAPVAIGGLWMAGFVWQLKQRPLVPLHDPLLAEVLEHGHAGH